MTRCEWSDLPTEDCAHCRGLTLEDAPVELAVITTTLPRYTSTHVAEKTVRKLRKELEG